MRITDRQPQSNPLLNVQQKPSQRTPPAQADGGAKFGKDDVNNEPVDRRASADDKVGRPTVQTAVDTKASYPVETVNFRNAAAENAENQAAGSGGKNQQSQNRLQSKQQANAAGAYAAVDKASTTSAKIKQEVESLYQKSLANNQAEQTSASAAARASQSAPQVLSQFG